VVDVATLTGAQVVALGSHAAALYANDDDLAASNRRTLDVRTQPSRPEQHDTDACAQCGNSLDRGNTRIASTRARVR